MCNKTTRQQARGRRTTGRITLLREPQKLPKQHHRWEISPIKFASAIKPSIQSIFNNAESPPTTARTSSLLRPVPVRSPVREGESEEEEKGQGGANRWCLGMRRRRGRENLKRFEEEVEGGMERVARGACRDEKGRNQGLCSVEVHRDEAREGNRKCEGED